MPRGGARAGAGSPPNLDKAITLLRRQIDWFERANPDKREQIALALAAVNLDIQLGRLLRLVGIERPAPPTDEERARTAAIIDAMEAEFEAEDQE